MTAPQPVRTPLFQDLAPLLGHEAHRPPYLQLLEFLARQKAPAGRLEQNDAVRHQLLSLLLKPGDHACFKENLEGEKVAREFSSTESVCLKGEVVAAQTPVLLHPPKIWVSSCPWPSV